MIGLIGFLTNRALIYFASASVMFFAGAASAYKFQEMRYASIKKTQLEATLVQVQQSAAADIRRLDNTITAQRAATSRAVALRRDLDSSRSELERLRDTLANSVPGTGDAAGSCSVRADPARELFLGCAAALVEMGGIADRHASDAQALIDAFPK